MECIGEISQLQVQRLSLKVGPKTRRRYDPTPLQPVPALRICQAGVIGLATEGEQIVDVHHRDHPDSKNREGSNGISLGFTTHYDLMRDRFGEHVTNGLAGENILIQTDQKFSATDLAAGVLIETGDGSLLPLEQLTVAEPCVEFSRCAVRFPDDAPADARVSEALAFLRHGVRGYYAVYRGQPTEIRVGDRVFLP